MISVSLFLVPVAILALGVLIGAFLLRAKKHPTIESLRPYHWFWGNLSHFLKHEHDMHDAIYDATMKTSRNKEDTKIIAQIFPFLSPNGTNIYLFDPSLIKYVFETKFEDFGKTDFVVDNLYELFGNGIFSADGSNWKWHRKVASRMFSLRNLRNYMFHCAVRNCDNLINKMIELSGIDNESNRNGKSIDIYDLFGRFTLDCFVESAFGESLNTIGKAPKLHRFGLAFDKMTELIDKRFLDPFWKLKRYFKIGESEGKLIPYYAKIIDSTVYDIIASRKVLLIASVCVASIACLLLHFLC